MKKNFYLYTFVFFFAFVVQQSFGQGCVAVKNMSSCSMNWGEEAKGFQFSMNYRYFRSFKHFVGTEEQVERVQNGTQVINNDNSINLGLSYTFNNRFSVSVIVPFVYIDRSSMYEHLGNSSPATPSANNPNYLRFHTQSQGIGDVRVIGYYNAMKDYSKGGLTLGFGFKAPTGNYNAKDYFHKKDGLLLQPVDQSIQPGDGGLGIIGEIDFNHKLTGKFFGYVNAMYMINPRNTNGTAKSTTLTNDAEGNPLPHSNENSVTDQYLLRAGARFNAHAIQASLGGRMECIPSKDLVGKSDGFRRPGYIVSIEPSAYYTHGAHTIGFNFPIALVRNRTRSQIDIARGVNPTTLQPIHGDAAFANWLLSLTYAYRFAKLF
jgi:hypothetical protein